MGWLAAKKPAGVVPSDDARLVDPELVRQKGLLGQARVISLESKPSLGGSMADPAYDCCITLEASATGVDPYTVTVRQRLLRSGVTQLSGDEVVAPVWLDRKDSSRVAIDLTALEREPTK